MSSRRISVVVAGALASLMLCGGGSSARAASEVPHLTKRAAATLPKPSKRDFAKATRVRRPVARASETYRCVDESTSYRTNCLVQLDYYVAANSVMQYYHDGVVTCEIGCGANSMSIFGLEPNVLSRNGSLQRIAFRWSWESKSGGGGGDDWYWAWVRPDGTFYWEQGPWDPWLGGMPTIMAWNVNDPRKTLGGIGRGWNFAKGNAYRLRLQVAWYANSGSLVDHRQYVIPITQQRNVWAYFYGRLDDHVGL